MESLVTALVDMYPTIFRKKNRRETLILLVSVLSYLVGLVMLTEVFWAQTTCVVPAGSECLPGRDGAGGCWGPCWGRELVGEPQSAAQCLGEAALPSPWCSHFPCQPSSLVPVTDTSPAKTDNLSSWTAHILGIDLSLREPNLYSCILLRCEGSAFVLLFSPGWSYVSTWCKEIWCA